jgi:Right handed beta helix region
MKVLHASMPALHSTLLPLMALALAAGLAGCAVPTASPEALLEAQPTAAGTRTLIAVGPVSPMPTGAVQVARMVDIPWASLTPGTEVVVAAGVLQDAVMINARGTAAAPITVRPSTAGGNILVRYGVDFQNASYVRLTGVKVEDSPWQAVMIRRGSDHITIDRAFLKRAVIGLEIADDAGTGHQILDNIIEDSATTGISVTRAKSSPTDRSRIAGNQVTRSGHHGMEINGSNYLIERNTVSYSGGAIGGTSGIHLYSANPQEDTGDGNIVRYNFTHRNRDSRLSDGNGIQVDQFCDNNEVSFNVSWANDGAGIIVFDGANNLVRGNTLKGNGLDPGRTHGDLGELIVNSAGAQTNLTRGNRVLDNVIVATRPAVRGLYIDYTTAPNANTVGPNLIHHRAGGTVLQRGGQIGQTGPQIDTITGTKGNLVEAPVFVKEAVPHQHGLKLARLPSGKGAPISAVKDMLGSTPLPTDGFFGAYYTPASLR